MNRRWAERTMVWRAMLLAAAACSSEFVASGGIGSESGPCYANNTCDEGLACLSDHCVRFDGGVAGASGGPLNVIFADATPAGAGGTTHGVGGTADTFDASSFGGAGPGGTNG